MQRLHNLFNASIPVPEVHVKQVDIARSKLLEGCLDRKVQRLRTVPKVHDLLLDLRLGAHVVTGILEGLAVSTSF